MRCRDGVAERERFDEALTHSSRTETEPRLGYAGVAELERNYKSNSRCVRFFRVWLRLEPPLHTEVPNLYSNLIRRLLLLIAAPLALVLAPAAQGQTAAQFSQWLAWYGQGDMRADYNNDQRVSPADFSAFLMYYSQNSPTDQSDSSTSDGSVDAERDRNGWTVLEPSADSRQIYVSPSGNDANSGLSAASPVRTLDMAYSLLRDGYPDWILIQRGAVYNDTFPSWKKSGRSATEPMVVTTYGNSTQRPAIHTGSDSAIVSGSNEIRKHLRFVGLRLHPHTRGSAAPIGVRFIGPVDDVLVEDCYIYGFSTGIIFQGSDDARASNVQIRRSIVANNWAMGQHAQGIFLKNIDDVLIEDCVIDQNGWHPQFEAQTRTIFNHNVYVQRDVDGLRFIGNFVSRAAAHGLQARNGGIVERNVFWKNPMSILWGNEGDRSRGEFPVSGRVDDNVVLEGIDLIDSGRGWGIHVQNVTEGSVRRNILSDSQSLPGATWGIGVRGPDVAQVRNLDIVDNVVHNWDNSVSIPNRNAVDVLVSRNVLSSTRTTEHLIEHREPDTLDNVDYVDNKYFQADSSRTWFTIDFRDVNLSDWRRDHDPQGDVVPNPVTYFPDSSWSLESYATQNGLASLNDLLAKLREQRREKWRSELATRAILNSARGAYGVTAVP